MLPYLGVFDNLAYKVDGYNVTLMGQVTRPTLKSDAENVVKRIEGVEHVDNQIEVLPVSPNDDRLRRQLYRAIYGYGPMQKYAMGVQQPIRIIVKNGNVTLEGVVDNESDKNIANIRAKGVSGVFGVTNNLQVVKALTSGVGPQTSDLRCFEPRSDVATSAFPSLAEHRHLPGVRGGSFAAAVGGSDHGQHGQ